MWRKLRQKWAELFQWQRVQWTLLGEYLKEFLCSFAAKCTIPLHFWARTQYKQALLGFRVIQTEKIPKFNYFESKKYFGTCEWHFTIADFYKCTLYRNTVSLKYVWYILTNFSLLCIRWYFYNVMCKTLWNFWKKRVESSLTSRMFKHNLFSLNIIKSFCRSTKNI